MSKASKLFTKLAQAPVPAAAMGAEAPEKQAPATESKPVPPQFKKPQANKMWRKGKAEMGQRAEQMKTGSFKQKFIRKYMDEFEKSAQAGPIPQAGARMGSWLPFIAASVLAGSLLQGMQAFIDALISKIEQHGHKAKGKEYYKKMLEAHPTLTKEDPETVAKYWDSLYHFAPSMAQDPLAAGAYIRQSIDKGLEEIGGPSADMVKSLTDIDSAHTKTRETRKPGSKVIDVAGIYPGKEITSIMLKEDVRRNPDDYGIPTGNV